MFLLRWVLCVACLFSVVLTQNLYAESQEAFGQTFLELVAVEEIEDEAVITIQSNHRFSFVDFVLYKPARLVIEVVGANIFAKKDDREILEAAFIGTISASKLQNRLKKYYTKSDLSSRKKEINKLYEKIMDEMKGKKEAFARELRLKEAQNHEDEEDAAFADCDF